MKFLWEQDMVESLDRFKNGCIPMHSSTPVVVFDVYDVLHFDSKRANFAKLQFRQASIHHPSYIY